MFRDSFFFLYVLRITHFVCYKQFIHYIFMMPWLICVYKTAHNSEILPIKGVKSFWLQWYTMEIKFGEQLFFDDVILIVWRNFSLLTVVFRSHNFDFKCFPEIFNQIWIRTLGCHYNFQWFQLQITAWFFCCVMGLNILHGKKTDQRWTQGGNS